MGSYGTFDHVHHFWHIQLYAANDTEPETHSSMFPQGPALSHGEAEIQSSFWHFQYQSECVRESQVFVAGSEWTRLFISDHQNSWLNCNKINMATHLENNFSVWREGFKWLLNREGMVRKLNDSRPKSSKADSTAMILSPNAGGHSLINIGLSRPALPKKIKDVKPPLNTQNVLHISPPWHFPHVWVLNRQENESLWFAFNTNYSNEATATTHIYLQHPIHVFVHTFFAWPQKKEKKEYIYYKERGIHHLKHLQEINIHVICYNSKLK